MNIEVARNDNGEVDSHVARLSFKNILDMYTYITYIGLHMYIKLFTDILWRLKGAVKIISRT